MNDVVLVDASGGTAATRLQNRPIAGAVEIDVGLLLLLLLLLLLRRLLLLRDAAVGPDADVEADDGVGVGRRRRQASARPTGNSFRAF